MTDNEPTRKQGRWRITRLTTLTRVTAWLPKLQDAAARLRKVEVKTSGKQRPTSDGSIALSTYTKPSEGTTCANLFQTFRTWIP